MPTLDSLPADQRAVIQLVLQRDRTYDQIASMLSIDRAGVRQRALAALDALGPHTQLSSERRALITDYLLGQLSGQVVADARRNLAESPSDRAWARVVAAELAPLASRGLPEIPVAPAEDEDEETSTEAEPVAVGASDERSQAVAPPPPSEPPPPAPASAEARTASASAEARTAPPPGAPRISRRGGAVLLGLVALAIVAVVVVLIATSGSNKPKQAASPSTSTAQASTSTQAQVLGQINLTPPNTSSKAAGIAEVIRQGTTIGIAIVAQKVPPNTKHDAYAVWLYNSSSNARILGFVNPGVGSNGRLSTTGPLPSGAGQFKQLIITRETQSKPKQPGPIILQGQLTGVQ
jgi:hypothetical protein